MMMFTRIPLASLFHLVNDGVLVYHVGVEIGPYLHKSGDRP
jgi:hypothetical protein